MSITTDLKTYADTAVSQGKQVLAQAQAQFSDVSGQANDFVTKYTATARTNAGDIAGKANAAVTDLRVSAEKALNVEAILAAVEPYLTQVKGYAHTATDRAEGYVNTVTADKRVAKFVDTAGSLSGVVVETVQLRVVKPVQTLAGRTPAAKPATKPAAKPASKPAAKSTRTATASTAGTTKAAPRKTAAKRSSTTKA